MQNIGEYLYRYLSMGTGYHVYRDKEDHATYGVEEIIAIFRYLHSHLKNGNKKISKYMEL